MRLSGLSSRWLAATFAAATVAATGVLTIASTSAASSGCSVSYTISSQWPSGFGANVSITNLGSPVSSWTLTWDFTAGQQITSGWNATYSQSGTKVTASSLSYNGSLGTGGSTSIGFNGSWNNASNPVPTDFAVNGVACNGASPPPSSPPPSSPPPSSPPPSSPPPSSPPPSSPPPGGLPGSFQWSSSGPLISPHADSHNIIAVKDPSAVYYNGQWYVAASTVNSSGGYGMEFLHFSDWSQANSATPVYADQTAIGGGYQTAPQLFYFAPQGLWYLIYQTGNNAGYSTNSDITNPNGWSATKYLYTSEPSVVQQDGSGWLDFFLNCDSTNCYLFSMNDNGYLFRSQTPIASFPDFGNSASVALHDPSATHLFEADAVYQVQGQNGDLLLAEAIGSDGHRYYTSYTAPSLNGTWTPLANTEANPFARSTNTTFPGGAWTQDISSGELIRTNYNQSPTISPCKIQFLYQGDAPGNYSNYNAIPWRIGMLTQTNSTC